MHTNDMQKREWCYAYIYADSCVCQSSPSILLNKSLVIDPYRPISQLDQMNPEQRKAFEESWISKLNNS